MPTSHPYLTFSPLVNPQQTMLGVHLRLHTLEAQPAALIGALSALANAWPAEPSLVILEFEPASSAEWSNGWQAPPTTAVVAAAAAAVSDSALTQTIQTTRATQASVGGRSDLCLRVDRLGPDVRAEAKYLAIAAGSISELQNLTPDQRPQQVLALDVDEPIDHARAVNSGAFATSGWSCLRWKRRPADKKVGMLSTILKLVQLIDRDADTHDIEAILKRDAVLSYKLVSMANSAAYGLSVEVSSIRHAIDILGRQKLKRWLSLLLLHSGGTDTPQVLLQMAFIRATFLESMGRHLKFEGAQEDLFLCGAFSLLDKILGISLTELLGRISISDAITDALVGDEGGLAPLMALMRGLESRDPTFLVTQCEKLALHPGVVNHALLAAITSSRELAAA
jgi:EAL and modified HD-GYP domain-containing signal transduction protein